MVTANAIQITNSGGTNLIGYRLIIAPSGTTTFVSGDGNGSATLPSDLAEKLRHDVDAAKPLAALPMGMCAKSASFGSSTYMMVGGDRSPDLSCPGSAAGQALQSDVAAVTEFLHVHNVPRGRGRELPPINY
jgi:hypothetical protein